MSGLLVALALKVTKTHTCTSRILLDAAVHKNLYTVYEHGVSRVIIRVWASFDVLLLLGSTSNESMLFQCSKVLSKKQQKMPSTEIAGHMRLTTVTTVQACLCVCQYSQPRLSMFQPKLSAVCGRGSQSMACRAAPELRGCAIVSGNAPQVLVRPGWPK